MQQSGGQQGKNHPFQTGTTVLVTELEAFEDIVWQKIFICFPSVFKFWLRLILKAGGYIFGGTNVKIA